MFFNHLFLHSFIRSLIHSFSHSFITFFLTLLGLTDWILLRPQALLSIDLIISFYILWYIFSMIHSFIHSFFHLIIHSFIHSFMVSIHSADRALYFLLQSTLSHDILSRVQRDSTPRFVRPSVRPSVHRLVTFYFFCDFYFLTLLLLVKWSGDLKYGPCPPARD